MRSVRTAAACKIRQFDEAWSTSIGAAGSRLRAGIRYENSHRDPGEDGGRMLDPTMNFRWEQAGLLAPDERGGPRTALMVHAGIGKTDQAEA